MQGLNRGRLSGHNRRLPFVNLTKNLAEEVPWEFVISPSEFGEPVENSRRRKLPTSEIPNVENVRGESEYLREFSPGDPVREGV